MQKNTITEIRIFPVFFQNKKAVLYRRLQYILNSIIVLSQAQHRKLTTRLAG